MIEFNSILRASLKSQTCTKISTVITLANNQHNIYGETKEFCVVIIYICGICQFLPNKFVPNNSEEHTFQASFWFQKEMGQSNGQQNSHNSGRKRYKATIEMKPKQ